jgi:hypothetical protein
MGMDASAKIFFGFKITDERLVNRICNIEDESEELELSECESDCDCGGDGCNICCPEESYEDFGDNFEKSLGKGFELVFAGIGDYFEACPTFIAVSKSYKSFYDFDEYKSPLKSDHFTPKPEWEPDLKELANRLNLKKIKIGWWVVAGYS